jgi:glutaconate CoA-transferase subunit A
MEVQAKMKNDGKIMNVSDAASLVKDGDQVALGGFTSSRNPMALVREIIRQGRKELYLVAHSHGQDLDLLIGAGCVKRLEIAYGAVARFAPTAIRFRKAVCAGQIEVEDYTNLQMTLRFMAGAMGLPFIPTISGLETDIVKISGFPEESRGNGKVSKWKLKVVKNPWDEEDGNVVLLPPLNPDVALLHAQYADEEGTIRIKGLTFADLEQAKSANKVIVSCEEILPKEYLRQDPDQNSLPHFLVDAVVHVPFGAHPTSCLYFYDYDPRHLALYKKLASDDAGFQRYLDEWVYPFDTQEQYLTKIGMEDLFRIKANPVLGYKPGLDRR